MKIFAIVTLCFFFQTFYGQTNNCAIKVYVQEKTTKKPIVDSLFISLSSTVTTVYKLIPDNEGATILKLLEPGIYNVNVSVKGFLPQQITHVTVGEGKTLYLSFDLTHVNDIKKNKRDLENKKRKLVHY